MKFKAICKIEKQIDLEITGATLLSVEEAKGLPDHLGNYSPSCRWWLRSPGDESAFAAFFSACVGDSWYIGYRGGKVDINDFVVRPALQIANLESTYLKNGDSIIFGDKEFEVISDKLALCTTDIGECCFRKDWQAEDANDYEKSDVKKFVDEWFEEVKKKEATSAPRCEDTFNRENCAKTEHSCRYCCRAIRNTQNASQFFCIAEEPYGGYGAGKERNLEDSKKVNNCPRFLPCSRDLFEE